MSGRARLALAAALLAGATACREPSPPAPRCGDASCAPSSTCIHEGEGLRCRPACRTDADCDPPRTVCGPLASDRPPAVRKAEALGVCRPPPPPCEGPGAPCPGGRACQPWLRADAWSWRCLRSGPTPLGAPCGPARRCAPPAVCVETGPAGRPRCLAPCQSNADCPPPSPCALSFAPLELSLCDPSATER